MLASYDMCADKRIEVGEILKRVPLGYFRVMFSFTPGDINISSHNVLRQ